MFPHMLVFSLVLVGFVTPAESVNGWEAYLGDSQNQSQSEEDFNSQDYMEGQRIRQRQQMFLQSMQNPFAHQHFDIDDDEIPPHPVYGAAASLIQLQAHQAAKLSLQNAVCGPFYDRLYAMEQDTPAHIEGRRCKAPRQTSPQPSETHGAAASSSQPSESSGGTASSSQPSESSGTNKASSSQPLKSSGAAGDVANKESIKSNVANKEDIQTAVANKDNINSGVAPDSRLQCGESFQFGKYIDLASMD